MEMSDQIDPKKDLLKEKNLWQIYKGCRKLPRNKWNKEGVFIVFSLLFVYAFFSPNSVSTLASQVREWADLGIGFASSILGFLLAGFTISATVTKPDLLVAMSRKLHEPSGLSYLKYNYFALIEVFIVYLVFVGLCVGVKIFGAPNGPVSNVLFYLPFQLEWLKRFFVIVGVVSVGTGFFGLIIILQSFIFNIYHFVMTGIRWELEKEQK
jgi:hypothetical protein